MKKNVLLLLFFSFFLLQQAFPAENIDIPGDGKLSDVNILYVGRWDRSNPNLYHSYWTGAYLRVDFTGRNIGILLQSGTNLVVSIDGEDLRSINATSGLTRLNEVELSDGRHSLLVGAAGQNEELTFLGLSLDEGAVTYRAQGKFLIEYIGDSITATGGEDDQSAANYAWYTAEGLNCDHTQIAFSGLALTTGYGCLEEKIGLDSLYFCLKNYNHIDERPIQSWDFSYTPNMIVINLGTNDKCGSATDAVMKSSMFNFLSRLRNTYPQTTLVVMEPFNGSYSGPIESAVEKCKTLGDNNIQFVKTEGWLTEEDYKDGTHPNLSGRDKIVHNLMPYLKPLLPSDIKNVKKNDLNFSYDINSHKIIIHSLDEIKNILLYNSMGMLVYNNSISSDSCEIDLSGYMKGYYILRVQTSNNELVTYKVLKG